MAYTSEGKSAAGPKGRVRSLTLLVVAVLCATALVAVALLVARPWERPVCTNSATSAEASLRGFFRAVQVGDKESAGSYLPAENEIDNTSFRSLSQKLHGLDIPAINLVDTGDHPMYVFAVADAEGGLLGDFNVLEESKGCYIVQWGIAPVAPQDPDASSIKP